MKLLESILTQGRKWSQIAKILGSRNENSVKNRYFSLLNKFKKKKNVENDRNSITDILKKLKEMSPLSISNNMIKKINMEKKNPTPIKKEKQSKSKPRTSEKKKTCDEYLNLKLDNKRSRRKSSLSLDHCKVKKQLKIEEKKEENQNDQISSQTDIPSQYYKNNFDERNTVAPQPIFNQQETMNTHGLFYNPEAHLSEPFIKFPIPFPQSFLTTQYPNPFYHWPMINDERQRNYIPYFNNFNSNTDSDLKNVSQLISSLSITDEIILEGQKLLSELTFKTNSLSSMRDRLSFIIPPSNSSLSKQFSSHPSMLLYNNNNPNIIYEDNSFQTRAKSKYQRRKNIRYPTEMSKDSFLEEPEKKLTTPQKNSVDKFFKDFNEENQKIMSHSFDLKQDGASFNSLNHLE